MSLLLLVACASPLDIAPPADLPDRVWFRTATETWNRQWWVAVREGRLWVRPNEDVEAPGAWALLGNTGLPEGGGLVRFDPPEAVVEVSADGCHLQAVSDAGVFYRATDLRGDAQRLTWTDRWGDPAGRGDGLRTEFSTARGWSVSDSHPFDVATYEDAQGVEHSVGMGVAHVYRLGEDGRALHFNDWWLPEDWSRQICGPERGTFPAVTVSASASTVLLLGRDGEVYTRLYDFDTAGENDLLTYSYLEAAGTTRALPPEPWARQPALPGGRLTGRVSIAQDGEGNDARVLRVEAEVDGVLGLWEKRIDAAEWTWVQTDETWTGPFLDEGDPTVAATAADVPLVGDLTREDLSQRVEIELLDFNVLCSPARAHLRVDDAPVTVDGEPLELAFHHVHGMAEGVRPVRWWESGETGPVRAALLLPEGGFGDVDGADVRDALAAFFGERRVVDFWGQAGEGALDLEEIGRLTPFLVPWDEKAPVGEQVALRAAR